MSQKVENNKQTCVDDSSMTTYKKKILFSRL